MTYRISITPKENLQRDSYTIEVPDKSIYAHYPKEAEGVRIKELLEETRGLTFEDAKMQSIMSHAMELMCLCTETQGLIKHVESEKIEKIKKHAKIAKERGDDFQTYYTMLEGLNNNDLYKIVISEMK